MIENRWETPSRNIKGFREEGRGKEERKDDSRIGKRDW